MKPKSAGKGTGKGRGKEAVAREGQPLVARPSVRRLRRESVYSDGMMRRPDPSSFYRLNEEIADELARLDAEGALDRLKGLLAAGGAELWVSAARPGEGLEELLGVLRAGVGAGRRGAVRPLEPVGPPPEEASCSCAPSGAAGAASPAPPRAAGGWDHRGVLPVRSRFTVVWRDGSAGEVYMPDHICPTCWNDAGNHLDACARVCGSCGFAW